MNGIVVINPGSGPVAGTLEQAAANMEQFVKDIKEKHGLDEPIFVSPSMEPGEGGRFMFKLKSETLGERQVEMPGLPLAQVRYMQEPEQNIWDFPRLFLDGSSWCWCFAISVMKREKDEE